MVIAIICLTKNENKSSKCKQTSIVFLKWKQFCYCVQINKINTIVSKLTKLIMCISENEYKPLVVEWRGYFVNYNVFYVAKEISFGLLILIKQ